MSRQHPSSYERYDRQGSAYEHMIVPTLDEICYQAARQDFLPSIDRFKTAFIHGLSSLLATLISHPCTYPELEDAIRKFAGRSYPSEKMPESSLYRPAIENPGTYPLLESLTNNLRTYQEQVDRRPGASEWFIFGIESIADLVGDPRENERFPVPVLLPLLELYIQVRTGAPPLDIFN